MAPGSTGFSNETILFDATWVDDGTPTVHHLVARIAPQAHTVFLEANFETQFRVMQAISEQTEVPVPEMLWLELDASWFGAREMTVGLVGNNLLNENIRNSVSYTKDQVLLPGLGVRAFANLKF